MVLRELGERQPGVWRYQINEAMARSGATRAVLRGIVQVKAALTARSTQQTVKDTGEKRAYGRRAPAAAQECRCPSNAHRTTPATRRKDNEAARLEHAARRRRTKGERRARGCQGEEDARPARPPAARAKPPKRIQPPPANEGTERNLVSIIVRRATARRQDSDRRARSRLQQDAASTAAERMSPQAPLSRGEPKPRQPRRAGGGARCRKVALEQQACDGNRHSREAVCSARACRTPLAARRAAPRCRFILPRSRPARSAPAGKPRSRRRPAHATPAGPPRFQSRRCGMVIQLFPSCN